MVRSCKKTAGTALCVLIMLSMLLFCAPSGAYAADIVGSGTCGGDLAWTFDSEGTLTVSGTGYMDDYEYQFELPWNSYVSKIKKVIIKDGVKSVGNNAFNGCQKLGSVEFPESLVSIGDKSFIYCMALDPADIPEGVTDIGSRAFSGCGSLGSFYVPKNVKSIGDGAFSDCGKLTAIDVSPDNAFFFSADGVLTSKNGETIITVPGGAALTEYTVPDGVTVIGKSAFYGNKNLTSVKIPKGVTSIEADAFCACQNLVSVKLPKGLKSIGHFAFCYCDSLTSVEFREGIETVGNYAFMYCESLSSVTLPVDIPAFGEGAFAGCHVTEVYYAGTEEQWKSAENNRLSYIENVHYGCVYPVTPGDANGDDIADTRDLTRLMKYLSGGDVEIDAEACDLDGSGVVNAVDLVKLMKLVSAA